MKTEQTAKGLLTGPGGVARLVGVAVLAATAAAQHPNPQFNRVQRKDILSLLPNWRFFAPNPATHDFHLLYRTLSVTGESSRWKAVDIISGRKAHQIVWFPKRRPEKACFDVCGELLTVMDKGFPFMMRSPAYRVLTGYLRRRIQEDGNGDARGFQFTLVRAGGYETAEEPETIFVSPLTPMDPDAPEVTPVRRTEQKEAV